MNRLGLFRRFHVVPLAALPLLLPLIACVGDDGTPAEQGAPVRPETDGGAKPPAAIRGERGGEDVDVPPPPAACDGAALPDEDACTIHESFGVFVSASKGSDGGDGSRTTPLASVADALRLAKHTKRRVYVCAEIYREALTLEDGVSVFGSFDCAATWFVAANHAARISAPSSPAVTAVGIKAPTRIEGLDVRAPDAFAPGGSSIAMRAVDAGALTLVGVRLEAGHAGRGESGAPGVQLVQTGTVDGMSAVASLSQLACNAIHGPVGCSARYNSNKPGGVSACVGLSGEPGLEGGPGGAGGRPGIYERDQFNFVSALREAEMGSPSLASEDTAQGAWPVTPAANGARGAAGKDGASATSNVGTITGEGFAPADGTAGDHGAPGQGGGGGRAMPPDPNHVVTSKWFGTSGAGGGAGGCPGAAGTAGQGGGASIALLAFDSPMHIDRGELRSGNGGPGGKGTLGSEPTAGGLAGARVDGQPLTGGGSGGRGGRAGVSGHGAGGPSIAMAHHGAPPTLLATKVVHGAGGAGQAALSGDDRTIPASPAGAAKDTHGF